MNRILLLKEDSLELEPRLLEINRRAHGMFQLNPYSAFPLPANWSEYPQGQFLVGELAKLLTVPVCLSNVGLVADLYAEALKLAGIAPRFKMRVEAPTEHFGGWLAQVFGSLELLGAGPIERVGTLDTGPDLVRRVWEACGTEGLADLKLEFEAWRRVLAPAALSGTRLGLAWTEGARVRSATVPFLPSGGWQSVILPFAAPPKTTVNAVLYNKPCRIWFRKFVIRTPGGEIPVQIVPGPGSDLSRAGNLLKLDGAYEPRQVTFITPNDPGPFELVMEFLLEAGRAISDESSVRIAGRLHAVRGAQ